MSKEAFAKAQEIKKANPELFRSQEEHSLARKITDSNLYDWNATARFLLTQLAVLAMRNEEASYPDAESPFADEKTGWCWMSQKKLALKIGKSLSTVEKLIERFVNDGVILERTWKDDNNTPHAEYFVVEKMLDAHQRPSQRYDQERPARYEDGSRKGTAASQRRNSRGKFTKKTAVQEEDDE
jgi:hypothetical protein